MAEAAWLEELPVTILGAEVTERRRPQSGAKRWGGGNGGGLEGEVEEQRLGKPFYSAMIGLGLAARLLRMAAILGRRA
jgi:hypothetical protein